MTATVCISCQKDTENTNSDSDNTEQSNTSVEATSTASIGGDVPLSEEGKRVAEGLSKKGYWYVEHWHKAVSGGKGRDNDAYNANKARWFQFEADGSYLYGIRKETLGKGTWTYNSDNQSILLLSEDKKYNDEFKLDYHSQGGMMSWASTKRFRNENIMVLLEEYVELMAELP